MHSRCCFPFYELLSVPLFIRSSGPLKNPKFIGRYQLISFFWLRLILHQQQRTDQLCKLMRLRESRKFSERIAAELKYYYIGLHATFYQINRQTSWRLKRHVKFMVLTKNEC